MFIHFLYEILSFDTQRRQHQTFFFFLFLHDILKFFLRYEDMNVLNEKENHTILIMLK